MEVLMNTPKIKYNMTQEDKAKAYDEAIIKAKALYGKPLVDNSLLETILPELKESDDEKIRKELIEHIKANRGADFVLFQKFSEEEIISWLEKQSEIIKWKPSKEEMDVLYGLAYITNQYDEHKEEVITRLYQDLKREFFNGSSYDNTFPNIENDVRRRSTIQVLEYARSLDTYNQYGKADIDKNIAWLEKQVSPQTVADAYLRGCNDTEKKWLKRQEEQKQQCKSTTISSSDITTTTTKISEDECHTIN